MSQSLLNPETACPGCGTNIAERVSNKRNDVVAKQQTLYEGYKRLSDQSRLTLGPRDKRDMESYFNGTLIKITAIRCLHCKNMVELHINEKTGDVTGIKMKEAK